MVFRFANGIFEPIWNRDYIDHVQITVAETVGVERPRRATTSRPARCATWCRTTCSSCSRWSAMEPPTRFAADAVRDEKAKVLDAVRRLTPEDVLRDAVRGQYGAGQRRRRRPYAAYRDEPTSRRDSTTETYVALQAADRQLALGRRAVLPAHRQAR